MTVSLSFADTTGAAITATVQGEDADPALPVVVLLHGWGGRISDMTAPLSTFGPIAFDRRTPPAPLTDRGWAVLPPLLPVRGYRTDPMLGAVTGWRDALLGAGFCTVEYTQPQRSIGADAMDLGALGGILAALPKLAGRRFALLAHSRGGLVARSFLGAATGSAFVARTASIISLHSPHAGSSLANVAAAVDALLARAQAAFASLGLTPPAFLAMLRATTSSPGLAELAVGSPVIAGIAAREPVAGVAYHSFGGTSVQFARLWADVFTPDSFAPLPIPFPVFHHTTVPVPLGTALDATASIAPALFVPAPGVIELGTVLAALAALGPELRQGSGDVLVTDASARLPFSASHTTHALTHLEALYDPVLQAEVVSLLRGMRVAPPPAPRRQARVTISPAPAVRGGGPYTVRAVDAATGAPITGTVVVSGGQAGRQTGATNTPLTLSFAPRRTIRITDVGREVVLAYPTIRVDLDGGYGSASVDTGLG